MTAAVDSRSALTAPALGRTPLNVEIQAMRALAVALVIAFHLWPQRVPGGYIGVDVFFVISGYLITAHISRQLQDGRFSFVAFYGRRIRRLLPAAFIVLLATLAAVFLLVPRTDWFQFLREIGASAIYLENWLLAVDSVDYLAAANAASPAQHFWTLSVEEQFYILWPILLFGTFALARRRTGALAAVVGIILVASLALSVYWTATQPAAAYFVTPTRAWEFAAGGLLAFLVATERWRAIAERVSPLLLGVAGALLVAGSAFVLSTASAFPGYLAVVPVAGSVLLLAASAGRPGPLRRVAGLAPIQFVGGISYSLYLWHWPLIILWPYAFGHPPGTIEKLVILALTIGLASATWYAVEGRFQHAGTWTAPRSKKPFAFAAAGAAVVIGIAAIGWYPAVLANQAVADAISEAEDSPCFGAAAMAGDCPDPYAVTGTVDPAFAATDLGVGVVVGDCEVSYQNEDAPPCVFGETENPVLTIALVGDSHAGQLIEVIAPDAEKRGWKLETYVYAACPVVGVLPGQPCADWSAAKLDRIAQDPSIDVVLVTNATAKYLPDPAMLDEPDVVSDLGALTAAGKTVFVVRDTPGSVRESPDHAEFNIRDCLPASLDEYDPCAIDRSLLITDDLMMRAAAAAGVSVVDLTDYFCDQSLCHAVIGGLVVYADGGHLSRTFATSLSPYMGEKLVEAGILTAAR